MDLDSYDMDRLADLFSLASDPTRRICCAVRYPKSILASLDSPRLDAVARPTGPESNRIAAAVLSVRSVLKWMEPSDRSRMPLKGLVASGRL
jgi:hypothetical protein